MAFTKPNYFCFMSLTKYTFKDLDLMNDSLIKHLKKLKKELNDTEIITSKIQDILRTSDKSMHAYVFLSNDFFNSDKQNTAKISWKKIVYFAVQKSDRFLNSTMLFEKIRI